MKDKQSKRTATIVASILIITQIVFIMPVFASDDGQVNIREIALENLEESFQKLALLEQEKIDILSMYLPEQLSSFIQAVAAIAKEDISTDEKLEAVIVYSEQLNILSAYGIEDCLIFVTLWVVAYVIILVALFFGVPFYIIMPIIMPLMMIGMWGFILCLV